MKSHAPVAFVLKLFVMAGGIGNVLANLAILAAGDRLLSLVGVPASMDPYAFAGMCCLSFTMGIAALLAARAGERGLGLLAVVAVGKASFALMTLSFHAVHGLHPFWLGVGAIDGFFAVVALLALVHSTSRDLESLQGGALFKSLPSAHDRHALVLTFSLTGAGGAAVLRLKAGLERTGYAVDVQRVRPLEPLFEGPLSFLRFLWVSVRAILRVPAPIAPLALQAQHHYDLVIVQAPTWLVGTSAPVEAIFQDPNNLRLFSGRDAVALVVARGAYRRNMAMLVRRLQSSGANVVGARGFVHQGAEPMRLMRLWAHLMTKGRAKDQYGLSAAALDEIERFGEALGRRTRPERLTTTLRMAG